MIKFGYVMGFRNPRELSKLADADFYAAMFEQIEYLDQAGFDTIWTTEHHFVDDGYLSSVMPMMAAMAARTKRVKVGSFVLLGPFYHPLRLAEDAALIDVISNGRLRLGIGVGYRREEFDIFQISRKERVGRTLEAIEILKRAWVVSASTSKGSTSTSRTLGYYQSRSARRVPNCYGAGCIPNRSSAARHSTWDSPATSGQAKS